MSIKMMKIHPTSKPLQKSYLRKKQYLKVTIKVLKDPRYPWGIHLITGLHFKYFKNDRVVEKGMHNYGIYETIMLSTIAYEVINGICCLFIEEYDDLDRRIRKSRFNFELVRRLYKKSKKVNFPRELSFIWSPNWSKQKNAKINSRSYNDRCFVYTLELTQN